MATPHGQTLDGVTAALDGVTAALDGVKAALDGVAVATSDSGAATEGEPPATLDELKVSLDRAVANLDRVKEHVGPRHIRATSAILVLFTVLMGTVFFFVARHVATDSAVEATSAAVEAAVEANFNARVATLGNHALLLEVKDGFSNKEAETVISELGELSAKAEPGDGPMSESKLELAAEIAARNFALAQRVDLVERLDTESNVGPLLVDKAVSALVLSVLGVQGVMEGDSWRAAEVELYEKYRERTSDYPELHALYDALIAYRKGKSKAAEQTLASTGTLSDMDRDAFVVQLSTLGSGNSGYPAEQSAYLMRLVCDLLTFYADRRIGVLGEVADNVAAAGVDCQSVVLDPLPG